MSKNEELQKSIDSYIDDLFTEKEEISEVVEKSVDVKAEKTADEAIKKAPKSQKDEDRKAGRPKQISDVPQIDEDGKRSGKFDKDIKDREGKEEDVEEVKQVKVKKSLSDEEIEEYQALKKAQAEKQAEDLKKAEIEQQENLIKSIVDKVSSKYENQIDELKKSLKEQTDLVKSIAKQPRASKSITNIEALEKSTSESNNEPESYTQAEMLDAAEELVKSGKLSVDSVIELENTGTVYNPMHKKLIEKQLNK